MRFLTLLGHKIKLHICSNPLQMLIVCVGGLICTLSVIILYGNVMPHMINETPEKFYRSFDVYLKEPTPIQELNIVDMANVPYGSTYSIEDIIVNSSVEFGKIDVKASKNNRIFEDHISDAAFILDGRELGNQLILSRNTAMYKQTDTFELLGKVYSVVGVATDNYIAYNEFYALNLNVNFFRIVLQSKPGHREKSEFTQILTSRFPGCLVKNADYYIAQDRELTSQAVIVMAILYALLFLSLAFILYDMLRSGMYVDMIFRLHGATPRRIWGLLVSEQLIFFSLFGGVACLMHHVFYENWFSALNLYEDLVYGVQDYLVIILCTDMLALCCMLPFVRKVVSKYSYRMKKEAAVF